MNVVVIVAHGLNCHWLGAYGNEWIATPGFDSVAGESIVFDRHFANDPSVAGFSNSCLKPFWSALGDCRLSTTLIDDRRGKPDDSFPWKRTLRTDPKSYPSPGDALRATFNTALESLPDSPWLLWIETDRLVPPWDFEFETYQQYAEESAGFIEDRATEDEVPIDDPSIGVIDRDDNVLWHRLRNSFASAVTSFDAELTLMLQALRRKELDRSAAWIVTSNFGLPIGEHGIVGADGSPLHEELVHLPLIVRLPNAREAMRRVYSFTQTSDLPATIIEMLHESRFESTLGRLATGQIVDDRELCQIATTRSGHIERSLRTHDWAYLVATKSQPARLYHKPDDIWEVNDLAGGYTDECDRLLALLNEETRP